MKPIDFFSLHLRDASGPHRFTPVGTVPHRFALMPINPIERFATENRDFSVAAALDGTTVYFLKRRDCLLGNRLSSSLSYQSRFAIAGCECLLGNQGLLLDRNRARSTVRPLSSAMACGTAVAASAASFSPGAPGSRQVTVIPARVAPPSDGCSGRISAERAG